MGRPPDCHCACGDGPDPPDDIDFCSACVSIPAVWKLTVSSVQNGTLCNQCTQLNSEQLLYYNCRNTAITPHYCMWISSGIFTCVPSQPRQFWTLALFDTPLSGSYAIVYGAMLFDAPSCEFRGAYSFYRKTTAFDCLGSNVLTNYVVNSGYCNNWPTTVTISPA